MNGKVIRFRRAAEIHSSSQINQNNTNRASSSPVRVENETMFDYR